MVCEVFRGSVNGRVTGWRRRVRSTMVPQVSALSDWVDGMWGYWGRWGALKWEHFG